MGEFFSNTVPKIANLCIDIALVLALIIFILVIVDLSCFNYFGKVNVISEFSLNIMPKIASLSIDIAFVLAFVMFILVIVDLFLGAFDK